MRSSAPSSSQRLPRSSNSLRNFCCDWIADLISATCSSLRPLAVVDMADCAEDESAMTLALFGKGAGASMAMGTIAGAAAGCGARSARIGTGALGGGATNVRGAAVKGTGATKAGDVNETATTATGVVAG